MAECAEYQPAEDDAHRSYHRDSFRLFPKIHIASFRCSKLEDVNTSHLNSIAFNGFIYFEKSNLQPSYKVCDTRVDAVPEQKQFAFPEHL